MPKSISKVVDRETLKPRREPYWQRISKGCYVGFRKMSRDTPGTWLARALNDGKQAYQALGDFSEIPAHQRYDAAKRQAEILFEHWDKGGATKVVEVAQACREYVEHKREISEAAANDAHARFVRWVYSDRQFSEIELTKLKPADVEKWRKKLQTAPAMLGGGTIASTNKRSGATLNRDMTALRAALNLAYKNGLVVSNHAWREKLRPLENVGRRRDVYLESKQRCALIEHSLPDVADFLRGLALLPLRPGALAALTVSNYDKRLKTLTIGRDKQGADRKITLLEATVAFFAGQTKNKLPGAPLFSRSDGQAWNKDAWKDPIKQAARQAELPDTVTAYTMRHSIITDLIHGGLDSLTVAQLSGTSIAMIEKHYGHLTQEHAKAALALLTV